MTPEQELDSVADENSVDSPTVETETIDDAALIEASAPFIGQWNQLISTTNWDKGAIIHAWRTALVEQDSPATEYSDDAWSRLVGATVSSQHVGRLRRTFERFGESYDSYPGIYWSHFQAALEWTDAEMYLEGAVHNRWSVSQMRTQRWESEGSPKGKRPKDTDIVSAERDEDGPVSNGLALGSSVEQIQEPAGGAFDPDFGSEPTDSSDRSRDESDAAGDRLPAAERSRPFADLPTLPDDVADAFESFKLAILRHKLEEWKDVSRDDMLATLDALKELALSPSES